MTAQRITIVVVGILLACFLLVACLAVVAFLYLGIAGPSVGNVFSNIVILTPTP
jgi:hypothetical protein